jgi:four helix bundle protein
MTNFQCPMIDAGRVEVRVGHRKQERFEPPEDWEREVPYDIRERTFQFAVRVLREIRRLPDDPATRVVAYQLAKSATSVGANVEEADGAESRRDFVHKMSIARKEARETRYWLRIVRAAILDNGEFAALEQESDELVRILSAIIASAGKP